MGATGSPVDENLRKPGKDARGGTYAAGPVRDAGGSRGGAADADADADAMAPGIAAVAALPTIAGVLATFLRAD